MKEYAKKLQGIDEEHMGALLFGRFKDGRPLAYPVSPELGLGRDLNDFDYSADNLGERTPCCAHTRRTNPRSSDQWQWNEEKNDGEQIWNSACGQTGESSFLVPRMAPTALTRWSG